MKAAFQGPFLSHLQLWIAENMEIIDYKLQSSYVSRLVCLVAFWRLLKTSGTGSVKEIYFRTVLRAVTLAKTGRYNT